MWARVASGCTAGSAWHNQVAQPLRLPMFVTEVKQPRSVQQAMQHSWVISMACRCGAGKRGGLMWLRAQTFGQNDPNWL